MDVSKLMPTLITAGIAFAVAKFVPNPMVKAAAYGVIGVAVARQVPVLKNGI